MAKNGKGDSSGRHGEIGRDAEQFVASPFGLIKIWRDADGRLLLAEATFDGLILGEPLCIDSHVEQTTPAPVSAAIVATSSPVSGFALCLGWVDGTHALKAGSWSLGRDSKGLLLAANDNPALIAHHASEPTLCALRGEELLFSWVEADTGKVRGQVRSLGPEPYVQTLTLGQTRPGLDAPRRMKAVEIAPFEFAVFWLSLDGREIQGTHFVKAVEPGDEAPIWSGTEVPAALLPSGFSIPFEVAPAGHKALMLSHRALDGQTLKVAINLAPDSAVAREAAMPAFDFGAFGDLGVAWASQDMLQLDPAALVLPGAQADTDRHGISAVAGDPILVKLPPALENSLQTIAMVDDVVITTDVPTRTSTGWVQLRADGRLAFTPDTDFHGVAHFKVGGTTRTGEPWQHSVAVTVEPLYGPISIALRDPVRMIPSNAVLSGNAHVADIVIQGEAETHGEVTLSGMDAEKFVVIGNGLYLRGGTRLEPTRKKLDVAVNFKAALVGAAAAASLTILVVDDPGNVLALAFSGRALAAGMQDGEPVATLDLLDAGAVERKLSLINNAGGRFALQSGNLVVANAQLFDAEGQAKYDIVVRVTQPNGISVDHKITLHQADDARWAPKRDDAAAPNREPELQETGSDSGHPARRQAEDALATDPREGREAVRHDTDNGGDATEAGGDARDKTAANEDSGENHGFWEHSASTEDLRGSSSAPDLGGHSAERSGQETDGWRLAARDKDASAYGNAMRNRDDDRSRSNSGSSDDKDDRDGSGFRFDDGRSGSNSGKLEDNHDRVVLGSEAERAGGAGDDGKIAGADDTLLFKPGFGTETIEHVLRQGGEAHDVLDLSLYGTTFEALRAAGAFQQVGADVVLTLNPADPGQSDKVILKSMEVSALDPSDFKFS